MIRVYINEEEQVIRVKGHATEYHTDAGNIVCAAVSALTCNLINSLKVFCNAEICEQGKAKLEPGDFYFSYAYVGTYGNLLVDSWMLGMKALADQYKCIEFCHAQNLSIYDRYSMSQNYLE